MAPETGLRKELEKEVAAEVEEVLEQARSKAAQRLSDARLRRDERLAEGRRHLARELERARTRALARGRLQGRNRLLARRAEELEETFHAVAAKLRKMAESEPERFGELLWTLFVSGRRLLAEGDDVRVRLGEGGEAVAKRLDRQQGVVLDREGSWYGVILESVDGALRVDCSLEALLNRCRRELEAEIEELLFEGDRER